MRRFDPRALKEEFSAEELEDFHVFVDGGVRRGTDILKALALGARAVGLGKPVAYAMSAYGEDGIATMLNGATAICRVVHPSCREAESPLVSLRI